MRHRKMVACALAALLALLPLSALAETSLIAQRTVEGLSGLNILNGTCVQRLTGDEENLYAMFNAAGERLSAAYWQIDIRQDMPYCFAAAERNAMNALTLLNGDGQEVVPPEYSHFTVPGEHWLLASKLAGWGDIGSTDVYYDGVMIGTLSAEEYNYQTYCAAHGAYLGISGGQAGFYLNSRFERVEGTADYFVTDEYFYDWRDGGVYHPATGQKAFDPACTLTADEVERTVWYDSNNGCFLDLQGNVLSGVPATDKPYQNVEYRGGDYLLVRSEHGAGIADMQGNEVLPARFSALGGDTQRYFAMGYQAVLQDGQLSWLDLNGNVTATVPYAMNDGDYQGFGVNGLFIFTRSLGETVIFTATAGELPQRYEDAMAVNSPCQRLLTVKLGGLWGAIDMDGRTVIPFEHESQLQISYDGTVAMGTNAQHQQVVYAISYGDEPMASAVPVETASALPQTTAAPEPTEAPAESAANDSWVCPFCNQTYAADFNFCPLDGTARLEEPPACPSCGYVMPDGSTPNFCPKCGKPFQ